MSSIRTIDQLAQPSAGRGTAMPAEARFFAEDGWVFRERPGQGIECVARYDEFKAEPPAHLDAGLSAAD